MPVCLITSGDGLNLNRLFKMVYAGFLFCKISIFPFIIDKCLGGDTLMLKPCFLSRIYGFWVEFNVSFSIFVTLEKRISQF